MRLFAWIAVAASIVGSMALSGCDGCSGMGSQNQPSTQDPNQAQTCPPGYVLRNNRCVRVANQNP